MISVIIPHLNDKGLEACLVSLDGQQDYEGSLEILVIDNGSRDPPVELCSRFENVRLLEETRPGPGPARNHGVQHASGQFLAFTDADCRVSANWLAEMVSGMADPAVSILGGAVYVDYNTPKSPKFTEPYERVYSFRNEQHIANGYSAAANMAVRCEVFDRVGGFGGREIAEDQDWGLRAVQLGYVPIYLDSMIVRNASRADFAALRRKWARHITHDYNSSTVRSTWIVRALAMLASPLFEISTVVKTKKLVGYHERVLCFACLICVRYYRSWKMLNVMLRKKAEFEWNEPTD